MKGISRSRPVVRDVALVVVGRQGGPRYQRARSALRSAVSRLPRQCGRAGVGAAEQAADGAQAGAHRRRVDPTLAVEDVLEMVHAGVYPATVVEQTIAQRWAKVMPKLRIEQHPTREKTSMHWFVRKDASMRARQCRSVPEGL